MNAADVTLSRTAANDLVVTVNATGNTIMVGGTFNSATHDGVQQIAFPDGTTWTRDQIAAAASIRALPGHAIVAPSDVTVEVSPQDGAEITGNGTDKGVTVIWGADSGNAVGQWWGDGNKAEGSDPSKVILSGLNRADVTLSRTMDDRWPGQPYDNLTITDDATGKTLTLYREFSGYSGDAAGSIEFADGTVLDHDQIAAAASIRALPGHAIVAPSDVTVEVGPQDGAEITGNGTDKGVTVIWGAGSGNAVGQWWGDGNKAEGSDPSRVILSGLNRADVTLSRTMDDRWPGQPYDNLTITDDATGKTLTLYREFSGYSGDAAGSIEFADGTVLDHDQIAAQASANLQAGSADVTLNAPDGTAMLTAGTGNDSLFGGAGNDTFVYKAADGNLTIQDHADASQAARSNTLQLSDLNVTDLSFTQQNNDLVLAIAGTGRAIMIAGEFNSADHDGVQNFKFADGSQLSRSDIMAKLHPPS